MKSLSLILLLSLCILGCQDRTKNATEKLQKKGKVTTYYLIRHAEKKEGNDPELTEKGKARAQRWAEYFKNDSIDVVYSTDTKRTLATAIPTAEEFGLNVLKYEPSKVYDDAFKKQTYGKGVLIVGHTTNIPDLANKILGKEKFGDLSMSQFGRLYVIKIEDGKAQGAAKTLNNLGNGLH